MKGNTQKQLNRIIQHVLFWTASFFILSFYFRTGSSISQVDFIYAAWFHLSLALLVYINIRWLIPRILTSKRYLLFGVLFAVNIAFCSALNYLLFSSWIDFIFPGYYFISYYNFIDLVLFHFIYATVSTLIKLSKGWFSLIEADKKFAELEKEKTEAELQALKAQINPHFLFNSLNNIYSLALHKSDKTADMLLILSNLMRYTFSEASDDIVPLEHELEITRDYIELQKIRSGEEVRIAFSVNGILKNKSIAPLLFLPLIENAFKHGVKGSASNAFVNINFQVSDMKLIFSIDNSYEASDDTMPAPSGGIGLQNVRKRLELIYKGRYSMNVKKTDDLYQLILQIDLDVS